MGKRCNIPLQLLNKIKNPTIYDSLNLLNEIGALTSKSKFGIFSDLSNLWKALAGGAHIVNDE